MANQTTADKRNRINPQPVSSDWVWSIATNAHIAADVGWFTEYTRFESVVQGVGYQLTVWGIGTVELPVRTHRDLTRPEHQGILRLENVLHVPSAHWNIVSGQLLDETLDLPTKRIIDDHKNTVAFLRRAGSVSVVELSGPPRRCQLRPSVLEENRNYFIALEWPDQERMRWEATKWLRVRRDLAALAQAIQTIDGPRYE
ncbi:hypothetical protein VTK56DRAFT_893 [Thermocarpiscus australiensis]